MHIWSYILLVSCDSRLDWGLKTELNTFEYLGDGMGVGGVTCIQLSSNILTSVTELVSGQINQVHL